MADGLSFKLELDTTKFVAELDRAKLQSQQLANAFKNANDAAGQSITTMKSALAQLVASGQGASAEATKLRENIKAATLEAEKLSKAAEKVDKEFENVGKGGSFDNLIGKFKEGQKTATEGGGMFGSLAGKLGELASPAGLATAAVGALAAGFAEVVSVGKEFETSVQSLSAVTGKSGKDLEVLSQNARDLAKEFGGSAAEQMESFTGILSRIGPQLADSPKDLKTFAENVNLLAKAGGIDATTAMESLTTSILQFGVDVNDSALVAAKSSEAIDILAASAQVGASEIPQVSQALTVAGSAAAASNVSLLETNSAIQVLATKGKFGAEAGTSLRNVLLKLQDGGKEQAKVLGDLGTSYEKLGATLTSQGLSAALKEINSGLQGLGSDAARNKALSDLFGLENIVGAQALIGNIDKLDQFSADIAKQTGAAASQAATRMATLDEQLKRGKAAIEDVAISVYQKISPGLSRATGAVFDFVKGIGDRFGQLYNNIAPVVEPIVKLIGGVLLVQFEMLKDRIFTVFDVINNLFSRLGEIISPLAQRFSSLFSSVGSGEDIMQGILSVIKAVWEVISAGLNAAVELAVSLFQAFVGVLTTVWDVGKGLLSAMGLLGSETKATSEKTEKSKGIFETLIGVLTNVKGTIAGVTGVFKFFKDTVGEVVEAITKLDFSKVIDIFKKFGAGAGDAYNKSFNEATKKGESNDDIVAKQRDNFLKLTHQVEDFNKRAGKLTKEQVETEKQALREKLDAQIQALKQSNGIADDQVASIAKQLDQIKARGTGDPNDTAGGSGDKKDKGKTAFQLAKDKADDLKKASDTALDKFKQDQEEVLLKEGRSELTRREKIALLQKEVELQEKLAKDTEAIFKNENGKIKVPLRSDKGESEADVNKLINDVEKKVNPLKIKLATEERTKASKAFLSDIQDIADALSGAATIEVDASFNQKKFVEDFLTKRAALEASIDEVKIKVGAGQISEDDADKALSVLTKALEKADKDFVKTQNEATKAITEARLATMSDEEREREKAINKLIEDRNKELSNVFLTESQRAKIIADFQKKIDAIRTGKKADSSTGTAAYIAEFQKAFDEVWNAEKELHNKEAAETEKKRADLQKQLNDVEESNKSKLLSYEEYAEKRADIEKQIAKLAESQETATQVAIRASIKASNKLIAKELDKQAAEQNAIFDAQAEHGEIAWGAMAEAATLSFASMVVQGKSAGDAMKGIIVETVGKLLQGFVAPIIASYVSFLGPFAVPAALVAVAGLNVLFHSLVGFREGGYTGDHGTGDVAGVVHGREFVSTAETTAKYRPLLEHLHRGGDLSDYVINNDGVLAVERRHYSAMTQGAPRTTAMSIASLENQMIAVKNEIRKGNKTRESYQTVKMSVDHDPALVFKSQSRNLEVKSARY